LAISSHGPEQPYNWEPIFGEQTWVISNEMHIS